MREMWRETIFVMLADLALKICSSVEASALEIAGIGRVGARLMQLMLEIRIFRPKVYCILAKKTTDEHITTLNYQNGWYSD